MNFSEAIQAMKDGKSVTRTSWSPEEGYLVILPGMKTVWHVVTVQSINAGNKLFLIDDYDATDWQISNGVNEASVNNEEEEDAA